MNEAGRTIYIDGDQRTADIPPADLMLSAAIAEKLRETYPGHRWAVSADHKGGVVIVRVLGLSGNWGFVVKIEALKSDPTLRLAVRAGGEILERYRLSRGKARADEYAARPKDSRLIQPDL